MAHSGVKTPAVKIRMENMAVIKEATATLGKMVQGKIGFDAGAAAEAKTSLIAAAAQIAGQFHAQEDDPKSEARPAIWTNWDDFVEQADLLRTSASALETGDLAALKSGFKAVGQACSSCHKAYRE